MNKRMREIQASIQAITKEVEGLTTGETKDLDTAEQKLAEIAELQKEFDILERAEQAKKAGVPAEPVTPEKASGLKAMAKIIGKKALTEEEKALVTGGANGENFLIPDDVKAEINELRKSYVSARSIVTVENTDALAGSVNYEAGTPSELVDFEDGEDIDASAAPSFVQKKFAIGWKGALIPISRILIGSEKGGLMSYIDRWFVKRAILTENAKIFEALKAGYAEGTPKAVAGWKALKKSINKDLDPSALIGGVIVTNQSGFTALDEEEDKDGRPVLQANPANPTQKLFQGLPIVVFPDAQLPNIDDSHFPVIYGDTKAGATFVEHTGLEFNLSEHFFFGKNQNCLRVIEGFDVMSTDTGAYIYGSFSASAN